MLAAGRNGAAPETTDAQIGFRVVRTPAQAQADFNGDGLVDAEDHLVMTVCMKGPSTTAGSGCSSFDLRPDNHVDLKDFAAFQRVFAGSR